MKNISETSLESNSSKNKSSWSETIGEVRNGKTKEELEKMSSSDFCSMVSQAVILSHNRVKVAVASLIAEAEHCKYGIAVRNDIQNIGVLSIRLDDDRKKLLEELSSFKKEMEEHSEAINRLFEVFSSQLICDKISNLKSMLKLLEKPENQEFLKELVKT